MALRKPILRGGRDPRRILAELVAIPSVHPEAEAGGSRPGEAALAAWLDERLRRLGADVEQRELAPGRPNVLAVFAPNGRSRTTVLLMPHLDTVGVAGMTVPPFRLTRGLGDRWYGRGACDTKGPTAALLAALADPGVQRQIAAGSTRWIVAATAGEEQGSLGATALFASGLRADFAVALEPTDLKVVHAAKGLLRVWLDVRGKAAHGSRPDRGVNAAYRALPLLAAIRDDLAPWLAAQRHPVLGEATVNVGRVEAGTELNIVPDRCRLGLDIRLPPGLSQTLVLRRLRALIRRHAPATSLSVHRSGPAFVTPRESGWAARLGAVAQGWSTADWFCDANVAAQFGVRGVAFGPGSIRQAHTRDEFITTGALDGGCAAFRRFLAGETR